MRTPRQPAGPRRRAAAFSHDFHTPLPIRGRPSSHSGHGEGAALRAPHPYVVERWGAWAPRARRSLRPQQLRRSLRHRSRHPLGQPLARARVVRPRRGLRLVPRRDRRRGRARKGALRPAGAPGGRADAQPSRPRPRPRRARSRGRVARVRLAGRRPGRLPAGRAGGRSGPGRRTPARAGPRPGSRADDERFWREWQSLSPLLHRAELFNGAVVYSLVAGCGVRAIASGDTHRREQVSSWKTLLPCGKDEEEIVAFLRSPRSAYLVPFRAETAVEPAAAA